MQIFIGKGEERTGPFSEEEVRSMIKARTVDMADLAWHQGMSDWQPLHQVLPPEPPPLPAGDANPYAAPVSTDAPSHQGTATTFRGAMYLYISPTRLIVMSLLTMGIYECYWIYRNWRYLKETDLRYRQIQPFWRGFFGVFHIHSLLNAIKDDKQAEAIKPAKFHAGALATCWILLTVISYVLGRSADETANTVGIIIGIPSFLLLLPVQNHINALNRALPVVPPRYPFSGGHVVCLVVGLIILFLVLLGIFGPYILPPEYSGEAACHPAAPDLS